MYTTNKNYLHCTLWDTPTRTRTRTHICKMSNRWKTSVCHAQTHCTYLHMLRMVCCREADHSIGWNTQIHKICACMYFMQIPPIVEKVSRINSAVITNLPLFPRISINKLFSPHFQYIFICVLMCASHIYKCSRTTLNISAYTYWYLLRTKNATTYCERARMDG